MCANILNLQIQKNQSLADVEPVEKDREERLSKLLMRNAKTCKMTDLTSIRKAFHCEIRST